MKNGAELEMLEAIKGIRYVVHLKHRSNEKLFYYASLGIQHTVGLFSQPI